MEVDENSAADGGRSTGEPVHKHIVQEMIRAIDVAGDFEDSQAHEIIGSGRRTWVAVKLVSFSYHWISRKLKRSGAGTRVASYLMRPRWHAYLHTFPRFALATLHYSLAAHKGMILLF